MAPQPSLAALEPPPAGCQTVIDRLHLDATIGFDAVWDRHALDGRPPLPVTVALHEALLQWGQMRVRGSGTLTLDGGRPEGSLALEAQGWQPAVRLAVSAGLIPPELQATVETVLTTLAGGDGAALKTPN